MSSDRLHYFFNYFPHLEWRRLPSFSCCTNYFIHAVHRKGVKRRETAGEGKQENDDKQAHLRFVSDVCALLANMVVVIGISNS